MEEKKFTPKEALIRWNRRLLEMQTKLAENHGELHDILMDNDVEHDEMYDATIQYFYFVMQYTETYQKFVKDLIAKEK